MAPALLPFGILVATGRLGIDFGFHWDEPYHLRTVRTSLERGVPLPGDYRYPGVSHWLALAALAPEAARALADPPDAARAKAELLRLTETRAYLLRTRTLFLIGTALGVLLTHALVLGWRERPLEAWVAACVLGLSFEVAYHARWIAPDGLLLASSSATLLAGLSALRRPGRRLPLAVAAVAAGLACGTKWPAGLLLAPVLLAGWRSQAPGTPWRRRAARAGALLGLFAASYLLTTPGTLLEPEPFLRALALQQETYSRGHLSHSVAAGPAHLLRVVEYFSLSFGSWHAPLALALFGAALLGLASLVREEPGAALVFLSFPVLYLLFFSAYPVMIPRNYLVLGPFFAVLCARGWTWVATRLPRARGLVATALALGLALNALWLARAAETIRVRDPRRFVRELARYLDAHPEGRYAASERVRTELAGLGGPPRAHVSAGPPEEGEEVVLYASEGYARLVGARPGFGLTRTWFGPYEVNFDYYPAWLGSDRIVVMPASHYPERRFLPRDVPPKLRPGGLD